MNSLFGRYSSSKSLPLDDILKALDALCILPSAIDERSGAVSRISNSRFLDITNILKQYEDQQRVSGWAGRPRIYTILHWIGKKDLMSLFIKRGFTDYVLPLSYRALPEELREGRDLFLRLQDYVLADAKGLELGERGWHVHLDDGKESFHFQKFLGSGASGDVHAVLSRLSHRRYALKRFRRQGTAREAAEWTRQFHREIAALKRVKYEHLVQVVGSYTDRSYLAIVMHPVADCNLRTYLDTITEGNLPSLRSYFGCLAGTLAYLHNHGLHHMDIKLENILIQGGNLFVADFGSSHDWKKNERSTTWHDLPKTSRYMPPELAKDVHGPRNGATDIWALGVVFLEMTSVLKGFKIDDFRTFLTRNASGHQFVFGNPVGTASWLKKLRQTGRSPDFDNEPLIWIHDMIRPMPLERPSAVVLFRNILQSSSAEHFRRICCADPDKVERCAESVEPDYSSSRNIIIKPEEDWVSLLAQDAMKPRQTPQKSSSIQAWIDQNQSASVESLATYWRTSSPEQEDSLNEELIYTIEDEDDDTVLKASLTSIPSFPDLEPLDLWNFNLMDVHIPKSTEEFGDYEAQDITELPYEIVTDDSDSEGSDVTITPQNLPYEVITEDLEERDGIHLETGAQDQQFRDSKTADPANRSLESRMEGDGMGSKHLTISPRDATRSSSSLIPHQSGSSIHQVSINDRGIKSEPRVDGSETSSDRSRTSSEERNGRKGTAAQYHSGILTNSIRDKNGSKTILSLSQSGTPQEMNKSSDSKGDGQEHTKANTEKTRPISRRQHDVPKAREELPERTKAIVSGPSTEELNLENLQTYNSVSKGETLAKEKVKNGKEKQEQKSSNKKKKEKRKRKPLFSAEQYIGEVWKAESSAATTALSENTKMRLSRPLSILKWQDKSEDYLSWFCEKGNSAAVRRLLEAKCNPGTKLNRRARPILLAARGGDEKHVKCARALLEHGADVDVKQRSTGKTPIHYAVELPCYKGHSKLIFELLSHGANPNVTDKSGETPLLKILFGGYEPLEKYRRDALALLLYYGADVNAAPPSTLNKPLHLAVRRKDHWAVGMLLEKGAVVDEPNGSGDTPLALAVNGWKKIMTKNQKEVAWQLLDKGASVNQKIGSSENTALHTAISHGLVDVVKTLLESFSANSKVTNKAGADLFQTACAAFKLKKVTQASHDEIMTALVEAVELDLSPEPGVCPLVTAVTTSNVKAAKKLLNLDKALLHRDFVAPGTSLLHAASENGDIAMVKPALQNMPKRGLGMGSTQRQTVKKTF